ncbi:Putative clathrin/coatomer adaptor, adaptin-like, armadillo-like helical, AP complex subunit beta [Septoria linicola]|uniref:Clathrin/coatomer adaptor, adaptin-like, armadillo-like helical, AP complex subunit beta n=1 Tax=Septoria linicola TaxID=215465 RepID=A0A9Q9AY85_9PEZI|nr:putative clathrin/coatomer adaptor, adaptin-like, armadillo-like helical, AP complex subunit beta [Septoria linicola]USW57320.1 Putative clathrin/coatomer adaptor, adaptin-like, armadillo-like helical, AP complex subunit beta [Septoria linicola]
MESIRWELRTGAAPADQPATARDLTLEAARDAGPRRSVKALPAAQIKKMLDSRHEREVLDGLRRVVAMQYANPPQPTLTFFPAVLKTLSNTYPSTRPLVYNYLVHHAEADPDTALLAINTIQKSLSDTNPRVRAMALKTMSGIKIPMIAQIISLAVKKGVNDLSPLVRKAAALACVKCIQLDASTRPQVEEYISTLLGDQQYYVAGAAVQAFMEICPDRLDLIHPVYRRLCKMIVDMDEWGQLAILRLFTTYSRKCFPRRTTRVKRAANQEQRAKDFYEDLEAKEETEEDYEEVESADPDLELFLKCIQPLLSSRNAAVILAVTRAYLYLSPSKHLPLAIGPLIALLRSPSDIRQVALYNIVQVCLIDAAQFVPYFRHFLVRSTEAPQIWRLKLEVLTLMFPYSGKEIQELILAELEHFSRGHNADLVRENVRAIGRCAQASSDRTSRRCLSLLLKQIRSPDTNLVGEAMEVIRHLIQRAPDEHRKTVIRLAKNLDSLTSPSARASIVWLIGEFAGADPDNNIAADVLRILVKNYADESDEVRTQVVLLAAKVYLHHLNAKNEKQKAIDALNPEQSTQTSSSTVLSPTEEENDGFRENAFSSQHAEDEPQEAKHPIDLLYQYTMLLARYTPSYSLRDRARLFRSLLSVQSSTELASLLLLAPKPVPQAPSPSESRKGLLLGSTSLVIGSDAGSSGMRGYEPLPDWVEAGHEPDPRLRDDGDRAQKGYVPERELTAAQRLDESLAADPGYKSSGLPKKEKTLDAWLDAEDEEEESSEEESEEETEEESGSEEGESEYETDSEEDERAGLVR